MGGPRGGLANYVSTGRATVLVFGTQGRPTRVDSQCRHAIDGKKIVARDEDVVEQEGRPMLDQDGVNRQS
jgi:hypothetical protein